MRERIVTMHTEERVQPAQTARRETVVVGYDGSHAAPSALEWVAVRARARGSRVVVIAVDDAFHSRDDLVAAIQDARMRLRERVPGIEVEERVADGGPASTLAAAAAEADLLVIGVRGAEPVRSALLGYVAVRTAARSAVPVCLVPDDWSPRRGSVVVGYDDDGSSDAALRFASEEAAFSGLALRVVHAWHGRRGTVEEETRLHRAILDGAVNEASRGHRSLSVSPVLARGDAVAMLARESTEAALVVIGGHHRGVWLGGLLGAMSWYLIGEVDVPLVVVPPAAPESPSPEQEA